MTLQNSIGIQEKVNVNKEKSGIAFLCVCTGNPNSPNFIENCTAMDKMHHCLNDQLGYLTIKVGMNVTDEQFRIFITTIKSLELPSNFNRVIFYFFGHGDRVSIHLADNGQSRQEIISTFESLSTPDVFKILIFDCCRATDESRDGIEQQSSANTLVINATASNNEAYYKVNSGCGLFTEYFTELAPKRNESIHDLLAEIRTCIARDPLASNVFQMPVSDDKLYGRCNLLAESQGTGVKSII
jgi:hypothetical protein